MPRKKCYGSEAEKQAAYRLRKKEAKVEARLCKTDVDTRGIPGGGVPASSVTYFDEEGNERFRCNQGNVKGNYSEPENLPVPVLAEPQSLTGYDDHQESGEARESTKRTDDGSVGSYPKAIGIDETERCSSVDSQRRAKLSTDRKFEEDRPGWYIFGKEVREVECWECRKSYTTTLEMNRFCSPKCKNEYLDSTFGKLRNQ